MLDAESGDTILFDIEIFPPANPTTIYVNSELPLITQGNITLDASNAGAILDGSQLPAGSWIGGIQLTSDWNKVLGLQVIKFTGAGISVSGGHHNKIGGDRSIGLGPIGQGNLTSGNDIGIGLWCTSSQNIVTGNLVGVHPDGVEDWGNDSGGILLLEQANHNTIGPGNLIAYNGVGIEIHDLNTNGNAITQNEIYHNGWAGIFLWSGGNNEIAAPVILDTDMSAGLVSGTACKNCTVEIFSDVGAEGQIFEGQTTAESSGAFVLDHDSSFIGPRLTGIVIDPDGNASAFSIPTSGEVIPSPLQSDNNLPTNVLQIQRSEYLADNRIGTLSSPDLNLSYDRILNAIWPNLGFKRIRLSFNEIEAAIDRPINLEKPEFFIDPLDDAWVTSIVSRDIEITYVLTFWDKDYQVGGMEVGCPRFKTEEEIIRYLDYVRFIVGHFKDRIQYYEIWNEPNNRTCPQWIEVDDYINLVRRAVPIIREEYPDAKIMISGTTGLNDPNSQDYLFAILNSDIMPIVDVIGLHPFYGASPAYDDVQDYYASYPSLIQKIKNIASASDFIGEYSADEMTWRTPFNAIPDQPWTYSEIVAAKYYARGIAIHLGSDIAAGVMPDSRLNVINTTIRNLSTIMAGANPIDSIVEIESDATDILSYSFSLPNGDSLIALWTNGAAVDNDPGIPATLTFPGFSAEEVVGIDPIFGFEQQMIATVENGNLVVRDLLVKDYPIFLRLSK